jgi:hypothetical protein
MQRNILAPESNEPISTTSDSDSTDAIERLMELNNAAPRLPTASTIPNQNKNKKKEVIYPHKYVNAETGKRSDLQGSDLQNALLSKTVITYIAYKNRIYSRKLVSAATGQPTLLQSDELQTALKYGMVVSNSCYRQRMKRKLKKENPGSNQVDQPAVKLRAIEQSHVIASSHTATHPAGLQRFSVFVQTAQQLPIDELSLTLAPITSLSRSK